jgi:hypothetical protein
VLTVYPWWIASAARSASASEIVVDVHTDTSDAFNEKTEQYALKVDK